MDDKRVIKVIKKVMPSVVSIAIAEKFEDLQKQFPKGFNPTIPDGTVDERGNRWGNIMLALVEAFEVQLALSM